jgi:hypothetical protein
MLFNHVMRCYWFGEFFARKRCRFHQHFGAFGYFPTTLFLSPHCKVYSTDARSGSH